MTDDQIAYWFTFGASVGAAVMAVIMSLIFCKIIARNREFRRHNKDAMAYLNRVKGGK